MEFLQDFKEEGSGIGMIRKNIYVWNFRSGGGGKMNLQVVRS